MTSSHASAIEFVVSSVTTKLAAAPDAKIIAKVIKKICKTSVKF